MDYAPHGFWSYIFFNKIKKPVYAVLFGLMPDTLSWGIYAAYRITKTGFFGRPVLHQIPDWAFMLYNITHSLIIAAAVILIIFIILRRVPLYIFAWPIAIIMDIFTHSRNFLPTPFLWPISSWRFDGIRWGTWQFMAVNWACIVVLLGVIVYKKQKNKSH